MTTLTPNELALAMEALEQARWDMLAQLGKVEAHPTREPHSNPLQLYDQAISTLQTAAKRETDESYLKGMLISDYVWGRRKLTEKEMDVAGKLVLEMLQRSKEIGIGASPDSAKRETRGKNAEEWMKECPYDMAALLDFIRRIQADAASKSCDRDAVLEEAAMECEKTCSCGQNGCLPASFAHSIRSMKGTK